MNPIIKKYPLDLTGENPNNLVLGEEHTLADNTRDGNRVFVLDYGSFYTRNLVIRDNSGTRLTAGTDYIATYLYVDASQRTGLEVMGAIVITNPNVSSTIYVDAQMVGGDYAQSTDALEQVLQTLQDDERPVEWGNIIGKPSEYPPGGHLHALWELYGFEPVVTELERIVAAIYTGDQAAFDELRQLIMEAEQRAKDYTDDKFDERLAPHLVDYDNPHRVTKTQVGLGNVPNNTMASQAEAEAGTSNVRFMSPLRVKQAIDVQVQPILQQHIDDKGNPHNVTKAQVGLGSVVNYAVASQTEAETGTVSNRYMTPERTKQAIDKQVQPILQEHVGDRSNPHQVTKSQVGLSSVDNYATATQTDAESGTRNDRFMTPLRTKQTIDSLIRPDLNAHTGNRSNPHQVTKSQVGLGSVDNYSTASQAEAEAGSRNDRFMTPERTKQAITDQVGSSLSSHISDTSNPHNVTKSQVGLGSVGNYGMASDTEARNFDGRDKYINPANVGAVMQAHNSSGDHDSRYVRLNAGVDCSLRVNSGQLQAYVNGSWRTIWPAQWS